jgi:hypothetical protein
MEFVIKTRVLHSCLVLRMCVCVCVCVCVYVCLFVYLQLLRTEILRIFFISHIFVIHCKISARPPLPTRISPCVSKKSATVPKTLLYL